METSLVPTERLMVTSLMSTEGLDEAEALTRLRALEEQVLGRGTALESLLREVSAFETRYLHTVGRLLTELDRIEQGEEPPPPQEGALPEEAVAPVRPSKDLKQLYRQVARLIHPDLARSDEERTLFSSLMVDANRAYHERDIAALEAILLKRIPARPAEVRTRIAGARAALQHIEEELSALQRSESYQLMVKVRLAEERGRDLLAEMAAEVKRLIVRARKRRKRGEAL